LILYCGLLCNLVETVDLTNERGLFTFLLLIESKPRPQLEQEFEAKMLIE
jgi:hypothetical protein